MIGLVKHVIYVHPKFNKASSAISIRMSAPLGVQATGTDGISVTNLVTRDKKNDQEVKMDLCNIRTHNAE